MNYILIDKNPRMVNVWQEFFGQETNVTMRVPMNYNISTSINSYLAMKATLVESRKHPKIETIAIPSFCTGVGKMQYEISARQMYKAFEEIEKGNKMNFANFGEAQKYHWQINT